MAENESIKFYILIPTRERPATLLHCLHTIIHQSYTNFEIIVSDNFSQDNTENIVASISDPRISYINTEKRVGMASNFEYALSHTKSGWVTILGDDDGLLPRALERIANIIKITGTDAISSTWCNYTWPNCSGINSILTVPLRQGWEQRVSEVWLSKLMKGEATYPELPMLYAGGFVSTEAIDRARSADGQFFNSINPDIYSAIAITSVSDTYIHINEPIAIAGISAHSNGAACLGNNQDTSLSELFYSENDHVFHTTLSGPRTKSINIAVYDSYLQASFLHDNSFRVTLIDQLSLAIASAPMDIQAEVIDYCKAVANKNAIEISDVLERSDHLSRQKRIKFALNKLRRLLTWFTEIGSVTYDAKALQALDVYDASIAAYSIWSSHFHNKNWRMKKIKHAFARRVSRSKNTALLVSRKQL